MKKIISLIFILSFIVLKSQTSISKPSWELLGTTATTNHFIGTRNAVPLVFKTNNLTAITIATNQAITIGGAVTVNTLTAPTGSNLGLNAPTGQSIDLRINNSNIIQVVNGTTFISNKVKVNSLSAATEALDVVGGGKFTTTLSVGAATNLAGGNSGTIAVSTDVLFSNMCTFSSLTTLSASTTYYFGVGLQSSTPNISVNTRRIVLPLNCNLVGYSAQYMNGVQNSTGTCTLSIRQNNTTNTQLTTLAQPANFSAGVFTDASAFNLNQSFSAGDTYELLLATPAFSVAPQNVNLTVVLYFSRK